MLRIYCLQQWYNLSDPGAEEALYDIQSMRAFCNLELGRDSIPDETMPTYYSLLTHGIHGAEGAFDPGIHTLRRIQVTGGSAHVEDALRQGMLFWGKPGEQVR